MATTPTKPTAPTPCVRSVWLLDGAADIAPLEAKLAANADDHASATRLELSKAYAAQASLPRSTGSSAGSRPP